MSAVQKALREAVEWMAKARKQARLVVPNKGWGQYGGSDHGWKGVHAAMPPNEFIRLSGSDPSGAGWVDEKRIERLIQPIAEGKTMEQWPELNFYDGQLGAPGGMLEVGGHEGRHRAYVSNALGVERIPVFLRFPQDVRVPRWAPWQWEKAKDTSLYVPQRHR